MNPSKDLFKPTLFLIAIICLLFSCSPQEKYHKIVGQTMGTYYAITYKGHNPIETKKAVEQLLLDFNNSLSTYIETSTISKLNYSDEGIVLPNSDVYFEPVIIRAKELEKLTNGTLNTSIAPLVNYWGFGYKGKEQITSIDSLAVDSLLHLVNQSNFELILKDGQSYISKSVPNAALDFSSLAKGYGIDIISDYFKSQNVNHYLIDIGGEARAEGVNNLNQTWTLAINKPKEDAPVNDLEIILRLENQSMATSGNYRIFYENGGRKFAHILNPETGYSALTNLLSVSVIADDCMTADGLATALMVMGIEKAKDFLVTNPYPACLIYDGDGDDHLEKYYTNGFRENVVKER